MIRAWKNDAAWIDVLVCLLISALVWLVCTKAGESFNTLFGKSHGAIYAALAGIFGSVLGFTITAASIIVGYTQPPSGALYQLKAKNPHLYQMLWNTFMSAIWLSGFAAVTALVGLAFDRDDSPNKIVAVACFFVALVAGFRIGRVVYRIGQIIDA